MKKITLTILTIICIATIGLVSPSYANKTDVNQCSSDSDCTSIQSPCKNWFAVKKSQIDALRKLWKLTKVNCDNVEPTKKGKAICKNNLCMMSYPKEIDFH